MILVTGATGDVGRQVIGGLLDADQPVRALVRDPARAGLPAGVEVAPGDLTATDALRSAVKGVDKVFLILADGGAEPIRDVLGTGIEHVVVLSGRNASEEFDNPLRGKYVAGEAAIREIGVPATVLQPNAFASLALHWAPSIQASGVVPAPFPEMAIPVIDPYDVAAVAVTALTDDRHIGSTYVLSGPEALTVRERAKIIGEVIGRELRVAEMTADEYTRILAAHLGEPFARAVVGLDQHFSTHPPSVVPTVRQVLGRPARDFRSWAADHAAAFLAA
jgi:uncharacterized protein YbjT (DUF2867 family)